jgi:hypothetical protein
VREECPDTVFGTDRGLKCDKAGELRVNIFLKQNLRSCLDKNKLLRNPYGFPISSSGMRLG